MSAREIAASAARPLLVVALRERLKNQAAADVRDVAEAVDLALAQAGVAHWRPERESGPGLEHFALVNDKTAIDLARVVVIGDQSTNSSGPFRYHDDEYVLPVLVIPSPELPLVEKRCLMVQSNRMCRVKIHRNVEIQI